RHRAASIRYDNANEQKTSDTKLTRREAGWQSGHGRSTHELSDDTTFSYMKPTCALALGMKRVFLVLLGLLALALVAFIAMPTGRYLIRGAWEGGRIPARRKS